ncbi:hypothetical protein IWW39_003251 [Coemansia spiralis]|uniref:Bromo domain-containing protein n=1 Tax=Coemansia spiralis TaxID=417178 RepID=A0A9W8GIX1_9FUNG|nr:hypothetical protein IWW39_003251 [Coemansia spiralis]
MSGAETPSKQPAKIKLSLKLGALKLQQAPAMPAPVVPVAARRFERTELDSDGDYEDGGEVDERRRQPGSMYMTPTSATQSWQNESASVPAPSSTPDTASGTHTPRIKLRFSFKGPATAAATPDMLMTPVSATPRRSAWSSVVPGSPSESMGSNESVVSDMDSDDSEGDGRTYDHSSLYSSAAATPRTPGGTGRPRGRPPLRGRRSQSQSTRSQTGTPGVSRRPVNVLTTSMSLKSSLLRLVKRIRKRDSYAFFLEPVDTSVITDYLGVIKTPMDLGTMQRKVETNKYRSIAEFRQDMLLICQNARKYNGEGSIYARSADRIQEYAIVAIDRETAKLESVGRASIGPEDLANDSDSVFGATSQVQSYAQSPEHSRSASPCPSRDDHSDGEYRRTTRRKWRAASASEPSNSAAAATPASIVDIFKWSAAATGKKKAKRLSTVPRKINELQMKVPLLADGSIDPTGFEDEVTLATYERDNVELPLIAGPRASSSVGPVKSTTSEALPAPVYAYGRHYLPASYADYGPRQHPQAAAETAANISKTVPNLQTIHGDSLGLAYWHSISDFIDGAGEEASTYATMVMDHLTNGAHTAACDTLSYLANRGAQQPLERPSGVPKKGSLSTSTLKDIVDWLERRPVRDRLFAQRLEALTRPIYLRDVSPRCAAARSKTPAAERTIATDAAKLRLFEKTSRSLKRAHDQIVSPGTGSSGASQRELEEIEDDIYTLAEQMCLSLTGSKQPTARLPALTRVPAPSSARPLATRPPVPSAAHSSFPVPPRPNRTMSTPVLPALNSASLAAAVCSDMMRGMVDGAESDYGYTR